MFEGHGGLHLDGDHLDLSYRNPAAWPNLTPKGSIKAFIFNIGDPTAGPNVQLGLCTPVEDEKLDWLHSIDPVHHHGSDQFRVVSGGEWTLAGRPLPEGAYAFQEAGWVYQEHPGPSGASWTLLLMGDRRGTHGTLKVKRDYETFFTYDDVYGVPVGQDADYPHPAGDKGIAAIATTAGPCDRGYLRGMIADLANQPGDEAIAALTGVLGDETVGPVVHVLKAGPNQAVAPACAYPTERVMAVATGSCRVGSTEYRKGDLRIQRADAPMDAVVSGPDGVELALIIADRRAQPVFAAEAPSPPPWMADAARVLLDLAPVPGGAAAERARAGSAPEA